MQDQALENKIYEDLTDLSDIIIEYTQEQAYFTRQELTGELNASKTDEVIEMLEGEGIMTPLGLETEEKVYSGTRFKTGKFKEMINEIEEYRH